MGSIAERLAKQAQSPAQRQFQHDLAAARFNYC
jgi:hypothetical protein